MRPVSAKRVQGTYRARRRLPLVSFVSRVEVERVVRCPFSVAHDYAEQFFREAGNEIDVRIPLRDVVYALPGKVRKPVKLEFALRPDETDAGRAHDALQVEWRAATRLLPDLHGVLRLRIATVETTRLTLEGTYRPPLGAAGLIFDALVGRRIARASVRDLLERIAAALEAREDAFAAGRGASGSTA
jgi:hypothetical protein